MVAKLSTMDIHETLSSLTTERLERKGIDILKTLKQSENNWSQVLYSNVMRYLLGPHNKRAAQRLATIIPHNILMRENSSLQNIEALLLGGAGLLDIFGEDSYTRRLKQEFEHLAAKYDITPMSADSWRLTGIHTHNHPTLRLAQIASCIHQNRLSLSNLVVCKNDKDVYKLFACRASEYWVDRLAMYSNEHNISSQIGSMMSNILAINVIVPILLTYGNYVESHMLIEQSISMLHNLRAEDNIYIRKWHSKTTIARDAFFTQALIQLSTEYCKRKRCQECPLGLRIIRRKLEL